MPIQVDILNNNDRSIALPTSSPTQYNINVAGGFKLTVTAATVNTQSVVLFYRNSESYDWPEIWKGTARANVVGNPAPKGIGMGNTATLAVRMYSGGGYASDFWHFEWLRPHTQLLPDAAIALGNMPTSSGGLVPMTRMAPWYTANAVNGGFLKIGPVYPIDANTCFETTIAIQVNSTNYTLYEQLTDPGTYTAITPKGTAPALNTVGLLKCVYAMGARRYYWL